MDCKPPGFSVHRVSQARILESVVISFSTDLPNPGMKPTPPALAGRFFTTEPLGKLNMVPRVISPKGSKPWTFIERTDGEAEAPMLWPPDVKILLIGKDPDAGKDWRQEEKGMTEDETVGWHHWFNGHEWASSGGLWRTGKPGVLQSMGSQRVGHDWATQQQQIKTRIIKSTETEVKMWFQELVEGEDGELMFKAGILNPGPRTCPRPWTVRSQAAWQEVSGGPSEPRSICIYSHSSLPPDGTI